MKVARGREAPAVALPEGVTFAPDYRITHQAVDKACKRALNRLPALEARENRALDFQRIDEMMLGLQTAIANGDPAAAAVALRAIGLRGRLLGYDALIKDERSGDGTRTTGDQDQRVIKELMDVLPTEKKRELVKILEMAFNLLKQTPGGDNG
jgi:hypothetical protein